MEDFASRIIALAYGKIFRDEPSIETKRFLKTVTYVGLGSGLAALLTFVFNVIAGRALGASGYGELTLVLSIGALLSAPMCSVPTAMVKYSSETDEYDRQRKIMSTSYVIAFFFCISTALICFALSSQISQVFSVSNKTVSLSIVFFLCYILFRIASATLQSLFQMKMLAIFQSGTWLISLIALLIAFYIVGRVSLQAAVVSALTGYVLVAGVIFVMRNKYILPNAFDRLWAGTLLHYSAYAMLGGVFVAVHLHISKLLINRYMTTDEVGIFNAYYITSVNLVLLLAAAFTTVLFPTASRHRSKRYLFDKISRVIPYLVMLFLPALVGVQYVGLKIYGAEYPFNLGSSILFGLTGIAMFLYATYGQLMSSVGTKGVKLVAFAQGVLAALVASLSVVLIPLAGINGAVLALIISYTVFSLIIMRRRKYFYESESD